LFNKIRNHSFFVVVTNKKTEKGRKKATLSRRKFQPHHFGGKDEDPPVESNGETII